MDYAGGEPGQGSPQQRGAPTSPPGTGQQLGGHFAGPGLAGASPYDEGALLPEDAPPPAPPPPPLLLVERPTDRPVPLAVAASSMSLQWSPVTVTVQTGELRIVEYLVTYELMMQQLEDAQGEVRPDRWSVQASPGGACPQALRWRPPPCLRSSGRRCGGAHAAPTPALRAARPLLAVRRPRHLRASQGAAARALLRHPGGCQAGGHRPRGHRAPLPAV